MQEREDKPGAAARGADGSISLLVVLHSTAWLVLANTIGLLLASLLLWPGAGKLLAPLTYGHWATLHLNLQLYGWCSIPLIGLLFRLYLRGTRPGIADAALQAWSGALVFSACAWLAGEVSGKPFMEWSGLPRLVMPAAMLVLALLLLAAYGTGAAWRDAPWLRAGKLLLLLVLGSIPFVMYWAADPTLYPPINPDSGGATGGSLLGSTLGVVAILLAAPLILDLPTRASRGRRLLPWLALAAHYAWFSLLDHGNRSHHEWNQIIALASLMLWLPLMTVHLRNFTWPARTRPWLGALCGWGLALLFTATYTFLPGVLDAWKFTNALVAHTHIAMAGFVSALLMLVLTTLAAGRPAPALSAPLPFGLWNFGTASYAVSMLLLGMAEAKNPAVVYFSQPLSQGAYLVRLFAGFLMTAASALWLADAWRAWLAHPKFSAPKLDQQRKDNTP